MNACIKEMRIKHWYKALIVFSGPLFSGTLLSLDLGSLFLTFLAFGFVASAVYVVNDIKDAENDKLHPKKCKRPIASGQIGVNSAVLFGGVLLTIALSFALLVGNYVPHFVGGYFALMMMYTFYLKQRAIVDAFTIATGFIIRALAGCFAVGIDVTPFFYLVIFSFAVYLAFCKRLTEVRLAGEAHKTSLEVYKEIVEVGIAISGSITLALYAIYTMNKTGLVWSVPLAFLVLMLHLRETFKGNEVHESMTNPEVLITGLAFIISVFIGLY